MMWKSLIKSRPVQLVIASLRGLQVLALFLMTQVSGFYANHLNFMRSVLYRSRKAELYHDFWTWILPSLCLIVAVILLLRYKRRSAYGALVLTLAFTFYSLFWTFDQLETYYLYYLLLLALSLFQMIIAGIKARSRKGLTDESSH